MDLSVTCTHCQQTITGLDEDDLVTLVQAHVAEHARAQGREHTPTREQILARLRLRRREAEQDDQNQQSAPRS